MSSDVTRSSGAKTIGWENEGRVNRGNDAIVRTKFAEARAAGAVTLQPLKDFEVIALKADLASGTKSHGDSSVDLGGGEQLINRNDRVYLRAGEQYSKVSGFSFPPQRMASQRR